MIPASILRHEIKSNERLPSTRELAEHLDVSCTVVVLVYEQLLAETEFCTQRVNECVHSPSSSIRLRSAQRMISPAGRMSTSLAKIGSWKAASASMTRQRALRVHLQQVRQEQRVVTAAAVQSNNDLFIRCHSHQEA